MGVKLFARKNRRMVLTDAGRVFVVEARGIINRTEDAVKRVRAVQGGKVGTLNVGYLKCIEMSRFPKTIQCFHEKYPGVHLNLERNNAMMLRDRFVNGKYDLIFRWASAADLSRGGVPPAGLLLGAGCGARRIVRCGAGSCQSV